MKRILITLAVVSTGLLLLVGTSMATFINPNSWDGVANNLENTLAGLVVAPSSGLLVNASGAVNDAIPFDDLWSVGASGSSQSTFIIHLTANTSEAFGIFDATDPSKKIQLFGSSAAAGSQASLSIKADGSVFVNNADTGTDFFGNLFGYYIVGAGGNPFFYSKDSLNSDGNDHMVAFAGNGKTIQIPTLAPGIFGPGEYILAFEDLPWNNATWNEFPLPSGPGSDRDYNDTIVMVESVTPNNPVPEPATMLLLGSGLIGLAGFARRKFKK